MGRHQVASEAGIRAQIEAEARRLSEELHLSQLRIARRLTQEAMAEPLGVSQAEVSKMGRRSELYIGTLKKFIEAMNGELVLAARFADGVEVPIQVGRDGRRGIAVIHWFPDWQQ